MSKETEDPDPVIDRHQDHVLRTEGCAVEFLLTAIPPGETTSVNIECHREGTSILRTVRHPDIQIQAVLAHRGYIFFFRIEFLVVSGAPWRFRVRHILGAHITERIRHILSVPVFNRFRPFPSHLSDRRLSIGNPPENGITVQFNPFYATFLSLYNPLHNRLLHELFLSVVLKLTRIPVLITCYSL